MAATKHRISASDLGIDLSGGSDKEVFRWLIACQLFGERISQDIAARTFGELDKAGYLTPRKLASAKWQDLVDVLGRGGYKRYDESTARELISIGKEMVEKYSGSMSKVHAEAETAKELREAIQQFKGIGPKASEIFVRDLKGVWT